MHPVSQRASDFSPPPNLLHQLILCNTIMKNKIGGDLSTFKSFRVHYVLILDLLLFPVIPSIDFASFGFLLREKEKNYLYNNNMYFFNPTPILKKCQKNIKEVLWQALYAFVEFVGFYVIKKSPFIFELNTEEMHFLMFI